MITPVCCFTDTQTPFFLPFSFFPFDSLSPFRASPSSGILLNVILPPLSISDTSRAITNQVLSGAILPRFAPSDPIWVLLDNTIMGGHLPDLEPHKRKRDLDDNGRVSGLHAQQMALQQGTFREHAGSAWSYCAVLFCSRPALCRPALP